MNAKETFSHLRKLARAKRDQDIKFAKAMRPIEICVWLVKQNRPIDSDPSAAVGQVLRTLREHPERFKEAGEGYWRFK